jgi:hypothetical protein
MTRPSRLTINAWTGEEEEVSAELLPDVTDWVLGGVGQPAPEDELHFLEPPKHDLRDWRDPEVGWGMVLADSQDFSTAQKRDHADVPEPLRDLLRDRTGAPVFHFVPDRNSHGYLHNYTTGEDLRVDAAKTGVGSGCLPYYLLICGTPRQVPWTFQYVLNTSRAVGRLDLENDAMHNYVAALRRDWSGAEARANRAVVWAVDHGAKDITRLMRAVIAKMVYQDLAADPDIKDNALFFDGLAGPAGAPELIAALARLNPALVVTTSHGMTGPLNDRDALRAQLGLPVDQRRKLLRPEDLLRAWQPDGAIWYAHACCSAGGDSESSFRGLVQPGSTVGRALEQVAGLGALTAPLPRALLGASRPLRAFIGHVEPTCDVTLYEKETSQPLTNTICNALYYNLFDTDRQPVGMAFRSWYMRTSTLLTRLELAGRGPAPTRPDPDTLINCRLSANDVRSLVILGDPTVVLPPMPTP